MAWRRFPTSVGVAASCLLTACYCLILSCVADSSKLTCLTYPSRRFHSMQQQPTLSLPAGCQHIQELPSGALHQIFHFLGPRDLCQVAATCRDWRTLTVDAAANLVHTPAQQHSVRFCLHATEHERCSMPMDGKFHLSAQASFACTKLCMHAQSSGACVHEIFPWNNR